MAVAEETLPRWDLTPFFAGLDSDAFTDEVAALERDIGALTELFDAQGIPADAGDDVALLDEVLARLNALLERQRTVFAYVFAHVSVDSRDEHAQARLSELQKPRVAVEKLGARFVSWVGSLDPETLVERSETASAHAYMLRRAGVAATHLMSQPEEELAAELGPTGATAWARLHGDLTSRLLVDVDLAAGVRRLPMSEVRALAYDADADVRRAAYEAELRVWEQNAVPLAAALNAVKGETIVLAERRGWDSPLAEALFNNQIDQETLDAMLTAVREALPDLRRYLILKARALGREPLAWHDLFAPLRTSGGAADDGRAWDFEASRAFILEQFETYSPELRRFAERAFAERWIDAGPREGKRDGAFCLPVRAGESRILANFKPSFNAMATLAHELGHGYHFQVAAHLTPLQRQVPMTAAETASIFCETIVKNAALADAPAAEKAEILDGSLESETQVTIDISSRFLFERGLLERRRARDLSESELCELMLETQRETYGDALDHERLHPYMWAVKPHYYFSSFYNFPYAFGLLFGLGLYARYEQDPEPFRGRYDELLASTGLEGVPELAARVGIDVRRPEFWRESVAVICRDVAQFEALVAETPDRA